MTLRKIYEIFFGKPEMTIKEQEMAIKEVEQIYNEGLQKIQLPPSQHLPKVTFGYRRDGYGHDEYFVIIQHNEYHFGYLERGFIGDIDSSPEKDDVLYYLFENATYCTASFDVKKCSILFKSGFIKSIQFKSGIFDGRRLDWKIQLNLLSIINPQFAQRKRKEFEDRIVKYPFGDGFPETLTYLDDYPCPVLTPGICPGSCPLDDNSGACTLWIPETTLREIEQKYNEDLRKIQLPPSLDLTTVVFGHKGNRDVFFVVIKNNEYRFGYTERDKPRDIYCSTEKDDVLYYLFDNATFNIAWERSKTCSTLNRTDIYDQRRIVWKIQCDLLSIIDPQFALRQRKECEEIITTARFNDEFANTFTFLDDSPCPLLNPGTCPSSCPLDDEGGACTLVTISIE